MLGIKAILIVFTLIVSDHLAANIPLFPSSMPLNNGVLQIPEDFYGPYTINGDWMYVPRHLEKFDESVEFSFVSPYMEHLYTRKPIADRGAFVIKIVNSKQRILAFHSDIFTSGLQILFQSGNTVRTVFEDPYQSFKGNTEDEGRMLQVNQGFAFDAPKGELYLIANYYRKSRFKDNRSVALAF